MAGLPPVHFNHASHNVSIVGNISRSTGGQLSDSVPVRNLPSISASGGMDNQAYESVDVKQCGLMQQPPPYEVLGDTPNMDEHTQC